MTEFPPFVEPLALVRRTKAGVDGDGNDLLVDAVTVVGGIFAPGGSTEQTEGQQRVTDTPSALLPFGTDLSALDAIVNKPVVDAEGQIAAGDWYELAGDPSEYRSPFDGWAPGLQVQLKRVAG